MMILGVYNKFCTEACNSKHLVRFQHNETKIWGVYEYTFYSIRCIMRGGGFGGGLWVFIIYYTYIVTVLTS